MVDQDNCSLGSTQKKYSEAFFQQWLDQNTKQLQSSISECLDPSHTKFFLAACQNVQDKNLSKEEATKKRDDIARHKPVDQDALDKANQAVKDAAASLVKASDEALQEALPLLNELETTSKIDEITRRLLIVTNVLVMATPKGLAAYCNQEATSPDHVKTFLQLLQDERQFPLLQEMVLSGGARHGKYGQALEIYTKLSAHIDNVVVTSTTTCTVDCRDNDPKALLLQRLALAVALELADPLPLFHQTNTYADPIQRYLHYEQAYLFGELDPVFGTEFGAWELRMVINSVAPDEQLGWGRQMLRNYRPDLMLLSDRWRYCRIVRTDVAYTGQPNWTDPDHLDFPQILSGGGECGPRAWMGRFICKAFGIPTWGVREPGHAAMSRWTPSEGWVVCLGAAMSYAWWEDQCGLYFQLETQARKLCSADVTKPNVEYGRKVMVLEWIADMLEESRGQVNSKCLADPQALWRSLSLMQRRRLAKQYTMNKYDICRKSVAPQLERIQFRTQSVVEKVVTYADGTILIPAACFDTTKPSANVVVMDSFLGGKQVLLNQDGRVQYTLSAPLGGKYQLSCRFVTVHDDKVKPPLQVTIDGGDNSHSVINDSGWELVQGKLKSCYKVHLQYTKGMWDESKPVVVDLLSDVTTCTLSLTRDAAARGIALKDIKLVPTKR